jgi:hypothetical protein
VNAHVGVTDGERHDFLQAAVASTRSGSGDPVVA